MSEMRRRAIHGLAPGDTFSVTRRFTREDTQAFGELTRDYNPVHYEPRFARSRGLSGLICHGLLTGSLLCEVGGQIALLATGMSFRFKRPVYFGDTVTCRLVIIDVDERGRTRAEASYVNQDGDEVAEAEVTGLLPGPADREVLASMVTEGDPTNALG